MSMEHGLQPRPACCVVCLDCASKTRWEQPFPTEDAAARWRAEHTRRHGHNNYETVETSE